MLHKSQCDVSQGDRWGEVSDNHYKMTSQRTKPISEWSYQADLFGILSFLAGDFNIG